MLEQRIKQHFMDSAELIYQAAQGLSQGIAAAIQALLACVTAGGKVLGCGKGPSAAEAWQFATFSINTFNPVRPELAALALTCDGNDMARQYARQVRALGQAGDVLLVLSVTGNDANLLAA